MADLTDPPPPGDADRRSAALTVLRTLRRSGHQALFAGGCVRDLLLGRIPKDYDVATDAPPGEVETLFPRTVAIGKAFGVIQVLQEGLPIEVATFRADDAYLDGRRPSGVRFTTAEEDAQRRDFTINGLFLDPETEEVIDYVGGREDLQRRVVRAIGEPAARFREDHLRLLRAVRFTSVLEFALDPATETALRDQAPTLRDVAVERIAQELTRLLTESRQAGRAIDLLHRTGLLAVLLPEIVAMMGVEQPPEYHPEGDVYVHTLMMLDRMERPTPALAWSVLLHDVGKPPTFARAPDATGRERIRFFGHADVGARMAEEILRRLRMPNALIDDVVHAVRNHMRFGEVSRMRESTLRKLVGAPTFRMEMELHRIDCLSSHGDTGNLALLEAFAEKVRNEPVLPPAWLSGHDVMALGIPAGPVVGHWLQRAYDEQLEGRCADREQLLSWLREQVAAAQGPADSPAEQ